MGADLAQVWQDVTVTDAIDLETAEGAVRDGMLAIGARLLEAGLAARGSGKVGVRQACACGGAGGLRGLPSEGGADAGGMGHAASRLLCLRPLRPRMLSAGCGAGRG